jgi:O-antigen/teichoic acid export membrane protein
MPDSSPVVLEDVEAVRTTRTPHLVGSLMTAVGGLGVALAIERGGSFLSNVLAARWGGVEVFGAYSVALMAANNVAWYAGSGIGTTSARFIAEHAPGTEGYRRTIRSLGSIGLISALVAVVALWVGAGPMARIILRNAKLAAPLQVAALSAAAFVLVECCRGVFIGTRNFAHILVLSSLMGFGLLTVVPAAARFGPTRMIAGQSAVLFTAVAVAVVLIVWKPKARPSRRDVREIEPASLGRVWRFGMMQLAGVVGMNASGWWTAMLVARGDPSLLQVAFYTVATQLRNFSSLVPSLVQQGNLAFFTNEGSRDFGGANRVIEVSSIAASVLSTLCAGAAVVALPLITGHMYGRGYGGAELPAVLAITTLLVHFGVSPAASRLTFVSLKWSGFTNGVWAIFVVITATLLVPAGGAIAATAILFTAHVISMFLGLACLRKLGHLPSGVTSLAVLDTVTALAIAGLAWMRAAHRVYTIGFDALILGVTAAATLILVRRAQRCGVLPKPLRLASLCQSGLVRLQTAGRARSAT